MEKENETRMKMDKAERKGDPPIPSAGLQMKLRERSEQELWAGRATTSSSGGSGGQAWRRTAAAEALQQFWPPHHRENGLSVRTTSSRPALTIPSWDPSPVPLGSPSAVPSPDRGQTCAEHFSEAPSDLLYPHPASLKPEGEAEVRVREPVVEDTGQGWVLVPA